MATFQTFYRTYDVQIGPKKVVSFKDYVLTTNDEEVAKKLRENSENMRLKGRKIAFWEAPVAILPKEETPKVETPKVEEVAEASKPPVVPEVQPPRRGRPPKVLQGMRVSGDT